MKQKEKTILFAGYTASEITNKLAETYDQKLKTIYSAEFIESAACLPVMDDLILSAIPDIVRGETGIFTTERRGLLGALWEMGEFYNSGFSIDMMKIPLRQETVEICEFLELDPYSLPSRGCVLLITTDPVRLKDTLAQAGIQAVIAGALTDSNARVLRIGEKVRYLDKPVR